MSQKQDDQSTRIRVLEEKLGKLRKRLELVETLKKEALYQAELEAERAEMYKDRSEQLQGLLDGLGLEAKTALTLASERGKR